MTGRLTPNAFLAQLGQMFDDSKLGGGSTVSITLKHYDGRDRPKPKDETKKDKAKKESWCLFRARFKDQKISCQVRQNESTNFQKTLKDMMLSKMDSLKKQQKKAKETP
uniref:Signal recognition particle 14 kDa protein n=1 Tax=Steinernema glaseri TaxID=37863 RepID=A0A1I7ZFR4_9BILA